MIDRWIAVDDEPEERLPEWARRGSGDRVVLGEQGIAHVLRGRGSVARWAEVLGVAEDDGRAYVLVPRQPPRAPWFEVDARMLPTDMRDQGVSGLAAAIAARSGQGGYRDLATSRESMGAAELEKRVRQRLPIAGAVEVPTRLQLAPWSIQKAGVALVALFFGMIACPITSGFATVPLSSPGGDPGPLVLFLIYGSFAAGLALSLVVIRKLWMRMDARYFERHPAPRMLVLAPDGCMVALEGGARAFRWDEIGGFHAEGDPTEQSKAGQSWLVVDASDGGRHGVIDGAWFGAPLPLIVAVAEAYRSRAR